MHKGAEKKQIGGNYFGRLKEKFANAFINHIQNILTGK